MIRGKYVLQNILGIASSAAARDVPPLTDSAGDGKRSMREQLTVHRANPTCAACHRNMDPLGFGLENYDAIGRWRDCRWHIPCRRERHAARRTALRHARRDADTSGLAIAAVLAYADVQKMLTYALRRSLQPYDRSAVEYDPSRRRRRRLPLADDGPSDRREPSLPGQAR